MSLNTRYLLHMAYIGTPFRGSQRQVKGTFPRAPDPSTVQGALEMGLKYIHPIQDTVVIMASRTDAGVHALNTTCHFDLYRPNNNILDAVTIMWGLNKFFYKQEVPIRILNSKIVPPNFHSRTNAISRTYLYRIIVGKCDLEKSAPFGHFAPIEEVNRAHFFCTNNFNVDLMRLAAKQFEGYHDFRTFTGTTHDDYKLTRREIFSIDIVERKKEDVGVSPKYSWPECAAVNSLTDSHLILDVYFKGKGFLYKQFFKDCH
ncbi:tRNA pseudouridine synthase A [Euwallacea similis]|uniref:tRNA pseudouridine synthase A n=1 Tax=Euwallacea similis TaxID=1736056 RepID=UPI00344DB1BF